MRILSPGLTADSLMRVAVDLHAVGRLEVDDPPMAILRLESRVLARHGRMVEARDRFPSVRPTDKSPRRSAHAWHAEVNVMDLKLIGHFRKEQLIIALAADRWQ